MNWQRCAFFLGVLFTLSISACGHEEFGVKLKPGSEVCMESLLHISNTPSGFDYPNAQAPVSVDLLRQEAHKMENLRKGIKNKKYILHYYHREDGFDIPIPPVKFPLFWKIDSTKNQTEGTFEIDIESEDDILITYKCRECSQITPEGKKLVKTGIGTSFEYSVKFHASPNEKIEATDYAVKLAPRKIPFSAAVGNHYTITLVAPETYCNAAKEKLEIVESKGMPNSYTMRFTDNSKYWASSFLKEIGIAMAMSDHQNADQMIQSRVDSLSNQIDALKAEVGDIERILEALPKREEKMSEFNAKENELMLLLEKKAEIQIKQAGMLPRILVLATGTPCGS